MNYKVESNNERNYPNLNLVAKICKIMAYIFIIVAPGFMLVSLINGASLAVFLVLPIAGLLALGFFAMSESIKVIVNISNDTYNVFLLLSNNKDADKQECKQA